MFTTHREELEWGGRPLLLETGRLARQADGAVLVHYADTTVLATAAAERQPREPRDFLPLTVNYLERNYAAGKIPGGYFKREGRPSEKETLVSRLIDRPLRPLFPKGYQNETQIIAMVLSHDLENDPDIVALIAASAALSVSGLPFQGPIGAARVGFRNGDFILNPRGDEMGESALDLVAAGTKDAILMVESEARELSEEEMLGAVLFAHKESQPVIEAIERLAKKAARPARPVPAPAAAPPPSETLDALLKERWEAPFRDAYQIAEKTERQASLNALRREAADAIAASPPASSSEEPLEEGVIAARIKNLEKNLVRGALLEGGRRIDGRDKTAIRAIAAETGILPRAHGSALFTRGETQALAVATLGTSEDEQFVDALEGTRREHFLLHYNFPPYSVGEVGRVGFTGRREVGHGKLAWRALKAVLPPRENFPYTLRLVSEITESNGSSSMATVCGASLAMMDAGVPLTRPVAGIAMGLIKDGARHLILSDILGDEDHLGDMDFKVAGTEKGVTALQMDIKIAGITEEIMREALAQAGEGRAHILAEMAKALPEARASLGEHAPRIELVNVPVDKIREVIGPGGRVIREIVEETGAKIDIGDDGAIKIASSNAAAIEGARARILSLTAEPEVGQIYDGKVVKVMDFGAFVNFFGKRDGLVHISQLSEERVERVGDIVHEGDSVRVKLVGFDNRGKVRLSMKGIAQNP